MDVLDAVIRHGASLSLSFFSVELTAQWDEILAVGASLSCYVG